MISTSEFKKGIIIKVNNEPYQIINYQFYKPGKGMAVMRTTLKNIKTGKVIDKTFRSGERFEEVEIEYQKATFLYSDRKNAVFLDENNNRITIPKEKVSSQLPFLKEKSEVDLMFLQEELIGIKIPIKVSLKVISAPPSIKGNTVSGATKVVTLETGLKLNVPIFIKEGENIIVNTETGEYVSRDKQ
ncbi:elongation factor P [bacterium]|nr:elongation factor P [bacterium]